MERIKKCFKNNEKVEGGLKKREEYFNEEMIFLELYFSERDFEILHKLGVKKKDKIYTKHEFDQLEEEVVDYYVDDDMDEEEIKMGKDLEKTNVNRDDYNELLDKIHFINIAYSF